MGLLSATPTLLCDSSTSQSQPTTRPATPLVCFIGSSPARCSAFVERSLANHGMSWSTSSSTATLRRPRSSSRMPRPLVTPRHLQPTMLLLLLTTMQHLQHQTWQHKLPIGALLPLLLLLLLQWRQSGVPLLQLLLSGVHQSTLGLLRLLVGNKCIIIRKNVGTISVDMSLSKYRGIRSRLKKKNVKK